MVAKLVINFSELFPSNNLIDFSPLIFIVAMINFRDFSLASWLDANSNALLTEFYRFAWLGVIFLQKWSLSSMIFGFLAKPWLFTDVENGDTLHLVLRQSQPQPSSVSSTGQATTNNVSRGKGCAIWNLGFKVIWLNLLVRWVTINFIIFEHHRTRVSTFCWRLTACRADFTQCCPRNF